MIQLHVRLFGATRSLQDGVPLVISRSLVRTLLRLAAGRELAACGSLWLCMCLRFWANVPEEGARYQLSQLPGHVRNSLPDPQILQTTVPAPPSMSLLGREDEMVSAVPATI